ncbi:MAG TPA: ParB/RepB/Spo0J family partition protein [Planctomycetota bacterium]|nr:ParB/RepB/Spo0J family partition protein [Planctomycetota bacterium]
MNGIAAVAEAPVAPAEVPAVPPPVAGAAARPSPDTDPGLETWTVPLAQIDAEGSPFRFRRAIKPDARLKELAASIDAQGLIHPLTVRRKGQLFELVSGFRRHGALSYLARTKGIAPSAYPVKVSVLPEGTTDDEALAISFAENLARKSLDATEKAIAVMKLRDEFGKSMEEIGTMVGLSEKQLGRLLDLLAAPDDVRQAFRQGRFGLNHALALAKVADPAAREAAIRRSGVRRLKLEVPDAAGAAVAEAVAEETPPPPLVRVPEVVRPIVRVAETADPAFPLRLTVRLRDREQAQRLIRYVVRIAS